jgi:hypothetical protein
MTTEQIKEKRVSRNKLIYIYIFFKNIVREKSKFIVELLEDKKKLKEERKKYSSWKNRIESVGSDYSSGGTFSSDNWGGAYGSTSSDAYYTKKSGADSDEKKESSDEESSSEEKKKKKKDKKKDGKKVGKKGKEKEKEKDSEESSES